MEVRRGFTLMETLVAMAIVGVLMGAIYVVYPKAKSEGKRTACVSNLRQLGQAFEMYGNDHDGNLPPFELCSVQCGPLIVPPNVSPTHQQIEIPIQPKSFKASLSAYTKSEELWWCPADIFRGQRSVGTNGGTNNQNDEHTSYVRGNVFQTLAVRFGQAGHSLSDLGVADRPRSIVLADRCFSTDPGDGVEGCQTPHGTRQNWLMADGSVTSYVIPKN